VNEGRGIEPGDALGASGQLNKVEPPSDGQVTDAAAPLACVARKRLPVYSQSFVTGHPP